METSLKEISIEYFSQIFNLTGLDEEFVRDLIEILGPCNNKGTLTYREVPLSFLLRLIKINPIFSSFQSMYYHLFYWEHKNFLEELKKLWIERRPIVTGMVVYKFPFLLNEWFFSKRGSPGVLHTL